MTQSETIRVEAIGLAIYEMLTADGWTTPESTREGNYSHEKRFSKEGYADIQQSFSLDDPDSYHTYITSLTLSCDKKLIRCTDYATPKKLRAFLVRADKLQGVAKDKAKHDEARHAKSKLRDDFIKAHVLQHCTVTVEEVAQHIAQYDALRTQIVTGLEGIYEDADHSTTLTAPRRVHSWVSRGHLKDIDDEFGLSSYSVRGSYDEMRAYSDMLILAIDYIANPMVELKKLYTVAVTACVVRHEAQEVASKAYTEEVK